MITRADVEEALSILKRWEGVARRQHNSEELRQVKKLREVIKGLSGESGK